MPLPEAAADLYVEIVDESARAEELREAQRVEEAKLGERCETAGDCRSGQCLTVERALAIGETLREGEVRKEGTSRLRPIAESRVCTTKCNADADCPPPSTCGLATTPSTPDIVSKRSVCVPANLD